MLYGRSLLVVYAAAAAKSLQLCPTLWPHGREPTRLPRLWDSPGKNTGVGCHFLLQCMKMKSESEVAQSCPDCLWPYGLQPTRLPRPWDFPGKSTGVGCHCLLEPQNHRVVIVSLRSAKKDSYFSTGTRKVMRLLYGNYQMNNVQWALGLLGEDKPRKVTRSRNRHFWTRRSLSRDELKQSQGEADEHKCCIHLKSVWLEGRLIEWPLQFTVLWPMVWLHTTRKGCVY